MKLTTVLFDLDGTLLPMDMDKFIGAYFKLLAMKMKDKGYEEQALVKSIWRGTGAMIKNDGSCTNEEAFWNDFADFWGEEIRREEPLLDEFYRNEFNGARQVCGFTQEAAGTVALCKELGLRVILATNPIFPAVATRARTSWAGLSVEDFELYTTYENMNWCKPNPMYYEEILRRQGLVGEECLMVGNDVKEDILATQGLGIRGFLLTDCLINSVGADVEDFVHGGFPQLQDYIRKLAAE